jgi:RHS repeat-associated protein
LAFKYDALGHRVQKVFTQGTNTTTTNYLYDRDNAVADNDQNGNVLARYIMTQTIDEPLAELRSGTTSYYSQDGLGSVTSLTTSAGTLGDTYRYDSFGNVTASSGSIANRLQYTAREFDAETNLYFYRARYYDQSSGRFLTEDPLGTNSDDLILCRFVRNSSFSDTDPEGYGGSRVFDCGAGCGFRLETDDAKGRHINWWCNGLKGCLRWPSMEPCEVGSSYVPPGRILRCIDKKLPRPEPPPAPVGQFCWNDWWQRYRQPVLLGGAILIGVGAIALAPATGRGSLLVFAAP